MPGLETTDRYEKALLWRAAGYDNSGEVTRADESEEIEVRWVDKQTRMLDPKNNLIGVDATVVVDEDIPVGSILWRGSLVDLAESLPGTGTGTSTHETPLSDIMRVVAFDKATDVKNRFTRRTAGLKKLSDSMPVTQ